MNWLTQQIEKVPQPWRFIAFCFVVLVVLLMLWFYGMKIVNGASNWFYSRGTAAAHEEIEKAKTEAAQSKQVAAEALKALEDEKKVTAAEKAKRELAESILADKSKNTDAKIAAYEKATSSSPVVSPPADTSALCQRAKSLGVAVDCQ